MFDALATRVLTFLAAWCLPHDVNCLLIDKGIDIAVQMHLLPKFALCV